jgi:hypothetical protein
MVLYQEKLENSSNQRRMSSPVLVIASVIAVDYQSLDVNQYYYDLLLGLKHWVMVRLYRSQLYGSHLWCWNMMPSSGMKGSVSELGPDY